MKVEGTFTIKAGKDRVWELMQDPDVLAACIPGCEKLEPSGEDTFAATLNVGVAGIKGRYQGTVAVADRDPPNGYRMIVEGKGGPGFVKGEGTFYADRGQARRHHHPRSRRRPSRRYPGPRRPTPHAPSRQTAHEAILHPAEQRSHSTVTGQREGRG